MKVDDDQSGPEMALQRDLFYFLLAFLKFLEQFVSQRDLLHTEIVSESC